MTEIRARLTPGRSVTPDDLADITDLPAEVGPFDNEGRIVVTFAGQLTDDQAEAVRVRLIADSPESEALLLKAVGAYRSNLAYLDLAAPTAAQVREQVAALTRQINGLIRLEVQK